MGSFATESAEAEEVSYFQIEPHPSRLRLCQECAGPLKPRAIETPRPTHRPAMKKSDFENLLQGVREMKATLRGGKIRLNLRGEIEAIP